MSEEVILNPDKMKFMMFTWMENPEEFRIHAVCIPEYTENDVGGYNYTGLTPMIRVFTGRGVFTGPMAHENFNALAVIMAARRNGELYHPVWGSTTAYLTELTMQQESRYQYIVYTFTFRETDEYGSIPRLPDYEEKYT